MQERVDKCPSLDVDVTSEVVTSESCRVSSLPEVNVDLSAFTCIFVCYSAFKRSTTTPLHLHPLLQMRRSLHA